MQLVKIRCANKVAFDIVCPRLADVPHDALDERAKTDFSQEKLMDLILSVLQKGPAGVQVMEILIIEIFNVAEETMGSISLTTLKNVSIVEAVNQEMLRPN